MATVDGIDDALLAVAELLIALEQLGTDLVLVEHLAKFCFQVVAIHTIAVNRIDGPLQLRVTPNRDVVIVAQVAIVDKPLDAARQDDVVEQRPETAVAHAPRCGGDTELLAVGEHLPQLLIAGCHAMVSLVDDDEVEALAAHGLVVTTAHEGLY